MLVKSPDFGHLKLDRWAGAFGGEQFRVLATVPFNRGNSERGLRLPWLSSSIRKGALLLFWTPCVSPCMLFGVECH